MLEKDCQKSEETSHTLERYHVSIIYTTYFAIFLNPLFTWHLIKDIKRYYFTTNAYLTYHMWLV
jgi:hypothetical protein